MSRGYGKRQRDILAKLAQHRDNPPDYNRRLGLMIRGDDPQAVERLRLYVEHHVDRYPQWMPVAELAGKRRPRNGRPYTDASDVAAIRRAVRNLEAAGLVETRYIWRNNRGQRQIGVRLLRSSASI